MADTLALEALYDAVVAQFAADGTIAKQPFGWREVAKYPVGARIAWVPGDPRFNVGADGPARNPGRNPRPIGTLHELFQCVISANDPSAPEDERAQYKATRLLYDAWRRAVYLAARGTFTIESQEWLGDKTQRRFGTAIRVVCSIEAMIPDEPFATAPVDVGADIAVSELDVTETTTATAADAP